ncbi:hypothetical protein [Lysinibacillus sp. LZ02]|uniref:hypothetical protein n=1 Tax=Lysinibacillus sp. LZ02 TaxID=3420668 RepID=UPI003D367612
MLIEKTVSVYYVINDKPTNILTKVFYSHTVDGDLAHIHYEVDIDNRRFCSAATSNTELAVENLQKILPPNIKITCCQTCRYGNFCPYGDQDNEIFCLHSMKITDKSDVCHLFTSSKTLDKRKRHLLDICPNYKPICDKEHYTYNDWNTSFK